MFESVNLLVFVMVVIILIVAGLLLAAHLQHRGSGASLVKTGGDAAGGDAAGDNFTHLLQPAGAGPHSHLASLDETGTGTSTVDSGHSHDIENFTDAGVSNGAIDTVAGHRHDVTKFIVDAAS